jgi:hypothetical protein
LPAALRRAAFGFALAIARTKALGSLATASASRLDPTPAVTVGQLQPDLRLSSATPFVCLLFLKEILFCFLKKHLKKKEKIKRNEVTQRYF